MMFTKEMLLGFVVDIAKAYASTPVDGKLPTPADVALYIKELHQELCAVLL